MDSNTPRISATPPATSGSMPVLYVSHGSPMTALEPREAGAFMVELGHTIRAHFGQPSAVLAISGHTLTREPVLLAGERQHAIYDFGGFDEALYQLRYDAPGAPELARQTAQLIKNAGLPVHVLPEAGLDHGIWTPLRYMWPEADVPVLPLGWPPNASPAELMTLGQLLEPLTRQGVLIMGTGSITHNLQRVFAGGRRDIDRPITPESAAFRNWLVDRSAERDWPALQHYRSQAPYGVLMHPTDEHLLPWFVAAGAGGTEHAPLRIHASQTYGDLGMDAFAFGPQAQALVQALPDTVPA